MANFLYLSYAAILAALFTGVLKIKGAPGGTKALLLPVVAALAYGNAVCGIGFAIGEGGLLKALNTPRFFFHVFATPLLLFLALKLARGFKVPLAEKPAVLWVLWILSALLVAAGIMQELASMELVPKMELGTLRYAHPAPKPPLGPIVANLVTIIAGALIWRRAGWPVLFVTSLAMLLTAGIPPKLFGQLPGNAGEIIFMLGFMFAIRRLAAASAR